MAAAHGGRPSPPGRVPWRVTEPVVNVGAPAVAPKQLGDLEEERYDAEPAGPAAAISSAMARAAATGSSALRMGRPMTR